MSTVNRPKREKLAKAGWKAGTATEFLHLTAEEGLYVGLKASLSQQLKHRREESHLTQEELARMVKSSQSRIAKMEKGDPSVSIDLLIKSLLALGTTRREIARRLRKGVTPRRTPNIWMKQRDADSADLSDTCRVCPGTPFP